MKQIRVGDIFCIENNGDYTFLQFLGIHPLLGECVLYENCKSDVAPRFSDSDSRIFFYPLKLNARKGKVRFVENREPLRPIPVSIRRPVDIRQGKVMSWFIDGPTGTTTVETLSKTQASYPIGSVVSHDVLLEWQVGKWDFLFKDY